MPPTMNEKYRDLHVLMDACLSIRQNLHSIWPWAYRLDGRLTINCTLLNQNVTEANSFHPSQVVSSQIVRLTDLWQEYVKLDIAAGMISPTLLFFLNLNKQ